jgi:putative sigma-54 modulation protein
MQVSVTFRNVEPTEALKEFAAEKVARIEKYVHTPTDAHVVLSVEKHMHKADITIKGHGMLMRGKGQTEDMYASIDGAVERIERQVKRYRNKLTSHKPREGAIAKVTLNYLAAEQGYEEPIEEPQVEAAPAEGNGDSAKIVKTKELEARPMTTEEAIMQMDLIHSDFFVFMNASSGDMNVIYRREGGFGLIEAPKG